MPTGLPKIDYVRHPAYGGMLQPDAALGEEALRILQPVIEEMTLIEANRVAKFGYRYGRGDAAAEDLIRDSFSRHHLPSAAMDRIDQGVNQYIDTLRQRLDEAASAGVPITFKMVNHVLSEQVDADLWGTVSEAMEDAGVYQTVRTFFGAPRAQILSLAVFVNPPNQSWIDNRFREIGIDDLPTAGMHIDSNGKCDLKAILYLNDVGPDQGPTCVVPGSHEWETGSQARVWRRAFDRSKLLGRSEKFRRLFISLPEELQVKAEFGGDLLAEDAETQALLAREEACTGARGTYTLFNPEAVHRGGDVRAGQRHALQITLRGLW